MDNFNTKFGLALKIAWALLMIFGICGTLMGFADKAVYIFIIGVVVNNVIRIVFEGIEAFITWRTLP